MLKTFVKSFKGLIGYNYGVAVMSNDEDPFIAEPLSEFDPELYGQLQDWTKRSATVYEVTEKVIGICAVDRSARIVFEGHQEFAMLDAVAYVQHTLCEAPKVEMISVEDASCRMHLQTAAGFSFKGKLKGDVLPEMISKAKNMIFRLKDGKTVDVIPTRVASRGHLHKRSSDKRRVIFVYPGEVALIEQMFVGPLYDALKSDPKCILHFGKNILPRLAHDSQRTFQSGVYSIVADYSGFDNSVSEEMIDIAFDIIFEMIDFDHYNGAPVPPAQSRRWQRVFEYIREYFKHTAVMLPDGRMIWMDGGVPSGSGFTQLVDSIVAVIALRYAANLDGTGILETSTLGDDVRLIISQRPNIKVWARVIERVFGMVLSLEKTKVRSARILRDGFLGYRFKRGKLYRPTFELFNLLLHPERDVKTLEVSLSRFIAYMFLGGGNDQKFVNFFMFYQKGYDFRGMEFSVPKEMASKKEYAGWDFPLKPLSQFQMSDFCDFLTTYKNPS